MWDHWPWKLVSCYSKKLFGSQTIYWCNHKLEQMYLSHAVVLISPFGLQEHLSLHTSMNWVLRWSINVCISSLISIQATGFPEWSTKRKSWGCFLLLHLRVSTYTRILRALYSWISPPRVTFPQPLWAAFSLYFAGISFAASYDCCLLLSITESGSVPRGKHKSLLQKPSPCSVTITGWSSTSRAGQGAVIQQGAASSARAERPWPATSKSCTEK